MPQFAEADDPDELSSLESLALFYSLATLAPSKPSATGVSNDALFRRGLASPVPDQGPEFPAKRCAYRDLPERELAARIQAGLRSLSEKGIVVLAKDGMGAWVPSVVRYEAWKASRQRVISSDLH